MHLEAEAAGHVSLNRLGGDERRVDLEHDVVEGGAKVGAVNAGVARRLGVVDVFAARAEELDGLGVGHVSEAHGQQRLRVAVDAGAFAKLALFVLVELQKDHVSEKKGFFCVCVVSRVPSY